MADLEVVLLGTGSPLPNPDRCGAGHVVVTPDARVLVDCGWGAARRLFAAGIQPATVDTAFFTHMHSDHITDVPDFLIMRWTGGATRPLAVYGPVGTRAMIDGFLAALKADIGYRFAHHGDKLSRDGIRVDVHEVPARAERNRAAEIGAMSVDAFEVDHFPVVPALGFRFDRAGRSIVFSGDTKWCQSLEDASKDADVLICEAMNAGMWAAMTQRISAINANTAAVLGDVPDYHMTTLDAAHMAQQAGVRHLVLSHLLPSPPAEGPITDAFPQGMSEHYSGKITVGRDLQRIAVGEEAP